MLFDKYGIKSDLITIATPAFNGKDDVENPANNPGIRKHIAIYNEIDAVSGGLAGDDYYTNSSKTTNIKVDASNHYKSTEGLDAHSFDNAHMGEFINKVNKNPNSQILKK